MHIKKIPPTPMRKGKAKRPAADLAMEPPDSEPSRSAAHEQQRQTGATIQSLLKREVRSLEAKFVLA